MPRPLVLAGLLAFAAPAGAAESIELVHEVAPEYPAGRAIVIEGRMRGAAEVA